MAGFGIGDQFACCSLYWGIYNTFLLMIPKLYLGMVIWSMKGLHLGISASVTDTLGNENFLYGVLSSFVATTFTCMQK